MNEAQGVKCDSCGKLTTTSGSIFVVRMPLDPAYKLPRHVCRQCLKDVPADQIISLADLRDAKTETFDCYWVQTASVYLDLRSGGRGWTCEAGQVLYGISILGFATVIRQL